MAIKTVESIKIYTNFFNFTSVAMPSKYRRLNATVKMRGI